MSERFIGVRARRGEPARRRAAAATVLAVLWLACAGTVFAQPEHEATQAPAHGEAAGEEAHHEGESLGSFLSRIANFLILAGGLYYLLRAPVSGYLAQRGEQIRKDLATAAATRAEAGRQLAELERRVAALPSEIESLKKRGQEEAAAEQGRINQAAEAEGIRLIEQTRREIERQLQIARRDLMAHAADLAVGVARTRLSHELTGPEQLRLVDRYVEQVGARHE